MLQARISDLVKGRIAWGEVNLEIVGLLHRDYECVAEAASQGSKKTRAPAP